MPWSAGVFNRLNGPTGWLDDSNAFIGIEATRHDTQDNDFRDGINACLNKDGTNLVTGNLNINNYRLTALGAATARSDAPQAGQVQDGDFIWLGTVGGTATALTANAAPAITAYKAGQKFRLITASGSTGSTATAHTLAINGVTPAKNIVNNEDSTNPTLGTWVSGALMELVYDGTNFRITNEPTGWQTWTPTVNPSNGTASSVVTNARFRKNGKKLEVTFDVSWTQVSASALYVTVSMPVNLDGLNQTVPAMIIPQGTSYPSVAFGHSTSAFRFYTYDATTQIFTGAARNVWGNFYYRSV